MTTGNQTVASKVHRCNFAWIKDTGTDQNAKPGRFNVVDDLRSIYANAPYTNT